MAGGKPFDERVDVLEQACIGRRRRGSSSWSAVHPGYGGEDRQEGDPVPTRQGRGVPQDGSTDLVGGQLLQPHPELAVELLQADDRHDGYSPGPV